MLVYGGFTLGKKQKGSSSNEVNPKTDRFASQTPLLSINLQKGLILPTIFHPHTSCIDFRTSSQFLFY